MAAQTFTINISLRSIVLVLGALGLTWAALQIPDLLAVFLIALILAAAMYPGVDWLMMRWKLPRVVAIAGMFVAVFGSIALILAAIAPTLIQQGQELAANLPAYVVKVKSSYAWIKGLDEQYHMLPKMDDAAKTISGYAATWLKSSLGWATALLGGFATFIMVLVLTFFVLLDGPDLKRGFLALVPPDHRPRLEAQVAPVAYKLGGYVQGVLTSIGFLMTYLAIALTLVGFPMGLALAILAGFCELIPMVGSLFGAIPAVLIALTLGWKQVAIVVAIFGVGNVIQGNVVAPYVFSRSVDVSPLAITLALLIGASLFGFAGALIAVPLMAMIQVLITNLYIEPMERAWLERNPEGTIAVTPPVVVPENPPPAPGVAEVKAAVAAVETLVAPLAEAIKPPEPPTTPPQP